MDNAGVIVEFKLFNFKPNIMSSKSRDNKYPMSADGAARYRYENIDVFFDNGDEMEHMRLVGQRQIQNHLEKKLGIVCEINTSWAINLDSVSPNEVTVLWHLDLALTDASAQTLLMLMNTIDINTEDNA